jgi:parvulin-like peptidyl-prolyl isomerase
VASLNAKEVLATVNGKPITKSYVNMLLRGEKVDFDKLPDKDKREILNQLIEKELLSEIAKNSGVEKDSEYNIILDIYKKNLMIEIWAKKLFDKTLVSDSEANKYYQENLEKFTTPEKVKARHILVKTEDEAKKLIEELKGLKGEELKKKFIELAKKHSIGPSAGNGGFLGEFPRGQMVKEFEEAVFNLKEGEITEEPVKTQFGYHIIYLEKKSPKKVIPFEKVKKSIIEMKRREEFKKLFKETVEKAKKDAKIEINLPSTNGEDKNSSK